MLPKALASGRVLWWHFDCTLEYFFFSNDGNASQNKIKAMIMSASKYLLCIAKKIVDDFTVAEYLHIHHFVTFFNLYLNIIRFDCYCTNLHFSSNFQICVYFVNRGRVSFQLESFCAAFKEEHKDPEKYKLFGLIADRLYCSVHRVFLRRTDFDERDKFRQRELSLQSSLLQFSRRTFSVCCLKTGWSGNCRYALCF